MATDHHFSKKIICLPTYNEAENLPIVVDKIFSVDPDFYILIIDDDSPDGTGIIAERISQTNKQISVLHRAVKDGLGRAYLHGFNHILTTTNIPLIIQMDADLSHSPFYLVEMLKKINEADLVIGSRYITGGKTENWGVTRRIISKFGSFYARLWLGIPCKDITSGYKVWRRSFLEKVISKHNISSSGYTFQVETTYIAYTLGAKIKEVPITFTDRTGGNSKMTIGIAFEAFWRIPLMLYQQQRIKNSMK